MRENLIQNALGCMTALLFLSACSPKVEPIEITTTPAQIPALTVPQADQVITRPVEWIIITENNYEEVFNRLRDDNKDVVLFGITAEGYENLSLNINDLRTHIEQKNAIIVAYRRYYVDSQNVLSNAVTINN